ncbi:patatin-like phospholipase family protein [Shimia ponticola]|uniref:patatin-like phospholipase family protein n=1 Tax=Shimia ponticola TaxID=2582893 RepID=UPI0011BFB680|nr:patatin-like phospholipase family protein [Shimia ponticola]
MKKRVNLALQGGGAHGAFTWGVLDRLLDEADVEVAAISGTSAGALNGAALKAGLIAGGRSGARENLNWLWNKVGSLEDMRVATWLEWPGISAGSISRAIEYSLPYSVVDGVSRMMSPYAYGPFYQNPLRPIVEEITMDRVHSDTGPCLFVCATNVRTGKVRVFHNQEISTEAIMASACLPTLFQAIEITDPETGETDSFWDGGYTGNPALFPLYEKKYPDDVVIVNINPLEREKTPLTPQEIQNRINEISFNSSLLRELRAISFVKRLLSEGAVQKGTFKDVKVHMIADDALMNELSVATKLIPQPYVIAKLKEAGQMACDQFLAQHKDKIGQEGSVDLVEMFS